MRLPHGSPCDDTYRRLFIRLDSQAFESIFTAWAYRLTEVILGDLIAIDGKTLRHSFESKGALASALHVVSAWSNANHLVLGQLKAPKDKVNEAQVIPELLKMLCLSGNVVSIDAIGCQKPIARQIIEQHADYILALKDNQSQLKDETEPLLRVLPPDSAAKSVDGDHGRIEVRNCSVTHRVDLLDKGLEWPGIKSLVKIEASREVDGKKSQQTRWYISSLKADAEFFLKAIRSHWAIENSLHWVLDVAFREDECRKRKGNSAENFAVIRKFAFNLLKKDKSVKLGVKNKRLRAGWNTEYLIHLISQGE